jgi:hypothetical protein
MRGVLAQLEAVPAMGRLEAREAHGQSRLLAAQIAVERRAEPIRQRLHCRRRHRRTATAFAARRQVVLRGNVPAAAYCAVRAASISF